VGGTLSKGQQHEPETGKLAGEVNIRDGETQGRVRWRLKGSKSRARGSRGNERLREEIRGDLLDISIYRGVL